MIKIKALNECEESSSEELTETCVITREAQEEGLHQLYSSALKTLSSGDEDLAKQMLLQLNDNLNIKSIKEKVKEDSFVNRLRFLTLKNLGLITNELNYFLDALELDSNDVSLWLRTGQRAALVLNYQLSRDCYQSAYHLSPYNWIVIDRLIDTYFILHDLYNCYNICCLALDRDQSYTKANILFNECLRLHPPILKDLDQKYKHFINNNYEDEQYITVIGNLRELKSKRRQYFEDERLKQESKRLKLTLILDTKSNLTLASIGLKLRNLFECIKKNNLFPSNPIEISFDSGYISQNDSGGNESGSANTSADESTTTIAIERTQRENIKEFKRSNSLRNSISNTFPTEFIDKRRSSRVKNILNKSRDIDERNVSESILELLPDSVKNAINEDNDIKVTKPEEETAVNRRKCNNTCETSEADIINSFVANVKSIKCLRKCITIDDLIEIYLIQLSLCKNVSISSVFSELYAIYRERCALPCGALCVIGRDIDLEQIWMCLTANELKFDKNEALFLTQMMIALEFALSKEEYTEYIVRLSMLRGTKESNNHFLNYALDILSDKNIEIITSNRVTIKYSAIKSILESQSQESMTHMIAEQNFEELIKILMSKPESELRSDEIKLLNDAIVSSELWQKGIDILSARNELNNECLNTIKKCLETGKRAKISNRLAVKLIKLCVDGKILAWICLYWGFIAEGVLTNNSKSSLIKFLKLGHQYLGKRGNCTAHNGEFLLLALQHFIESDVEHEILKCFSCLYNFPIRRIPNLQSSSMTNIHISPNITLKWEHCEALYHYFAPEELPEYDSLIRQTGITQEIEALLLRIVELVPEHLKPSKHSKPILQYIESGDQIPIETSAETSHITETIYYLLADYYFKNKEFKKAEYYYILDLSLNPNRFDSWAGSALSRSYRVNNSLDKGENTDNQFYKQTYSTLRCFEISLKLESSNTKLWIEYGHFVYNISSNASRVRKTSLFMTQIEFKIEIEDMIKIARNCFESANNTDSSDEVWLPYYMLGKVMEKSSGGLLIALKYYEWAELCLYVDGTSYPKKIQYHNPPHLAVEALEIYYRIHAATLKYLTINKKFSTRFLKKIKIHLIRALRSPFSKQLTPSSATSAAPVDHDYATAGVTALSSNTFAKINDSVSELMNDLLNAVVWKERKVDSNKLREELVILCLNAMKRCVNRYPAHYKSIYRLAHYYHNSNDNITAKQLLLGFPPISNKSNSSNTEFEFNEMDVNNENTKVIPGLFGERKTNNLFNGIWRIPIDDIDRPGSFNAHMFRSTFLLIRVCTFTDDFHTLCTIAIQLSRTPDAGKRYLRDSDRQILARFAFDSCHVLLKSHLETPLHFSREKILHDIQKICDRFIKSNIFVSETNAFLRDTFQLNRR